MPTVERCERFASHREKAVELFASKGFAQVGMRELAAYLGMAPGSLYHHYPSKRHLLLDILEEFYEELLAALAGVGSQGRDSVVEVVRAHVKLHQELPRHFSIALRDSGCLSIEQQQKTQHLRALYEVRLLAVLYGTSKGREATASVGRIIASLLNTAPSWFADQWLEEGGSAQLMETMMVGAIERLIGEREALIP